MHPAPPSTNVCVPKLESRGSCSPPQAIPHSPPPRLFLPPPSDYSSLLPQAIPHSSPRPSLTPPPGHPSLLPHPPPQDHCSLLPQIIPPSSPRLSFTPPPDPSCFPSEPHTKLARIQLTFLAFLATFLTMKWRMMNSGKRCCVSRETRMFPYLMAAFGGQYSSHFVYEE